MPEEKPDVFNPNISDKEKIAAEEMKRRTDEQIRLRNEKLRELEESTKVIEKNREETYKQYQLKGAPKVGDVVESPVNMEISPKYHNELDVISQPQMNQAWDMIPLPSEGKIYPSKKGRIKVAYLTTSDEDILTSPNLIESGMWLEILFNRKILEPEIRYRDLHLGDRNAIMIWLRATAYGTIYPIKVYDKNGEEFEHDFDLQTLKNIPLKAEPDDRGWFDFTLPVSKNEVKFRLLNMGDLEDIEKYTEAHKDDLVNRESTMVLEKQLVSINGNTDREYIRNYANNMRVADAKALRDYVTSVQSGVDLQVTIGTPGGGSVTTFLPFGLNFLWPDLGL